MCNVTDFRNGMSCVSSAVHIVSTDGPAGLGGCTISAFTSITDSPPTLMICLNTKASVAKLIEENGCFTVNTLSCDDQALADIFAGQRGISGAERFLYGDWDMEGDCPRLKSSLVSFECHASEFRYIATHYAILGTIQQVFTGPPREALVYHNRTYRRAAEMPSAARMVA